MPESPSRSVPSSRGSKPRPLSITDTSTKVRLLRNTTETLAASLCLRTFESASWTTRKSTIFCESLRSLSPPSTSSRVSMSVAFSRERSSRCTASATGRATAVVDRIECATSRRRSPPAPRRVPSLDGPGMNLSRAGDRAVECCAGNLAQAAAARRLPVTDETGRGAGGVDDPEGAGGRRSEPDDQGERELGGDDRRQLGELLAAEGTTEDGEGR